MFSMKNLENMECNIKRVKAVSQNSMRALTTEKKKKL